jgi:hypothetical protein
MRYDSSDKKSTDLDNPTAQVSVLQAKIGGSLPKRTETLSL